MRFATPFGALIPLLCVVAASTLVARAPLPAPSTEPSLRQWRINRFLELAIDTGYPARKEGQSEEEFETQVRNLAGLIYDKEQEVIREQVTGHDGGMHFSNIGPPIWNSFTRAMIDTEKNQQARQNGHLVRFRFMPRPRLGF
ncbi:MAG: hypothetical protein M1815_002447 [Lichina confinis]|nr:MAG: hypothetical protein M1815_002447 [Lichina confinis]